MGRPWRFCVLSARWGKGESLALPHCVPKQKTAQISGSLLNNVHAVYTATSPYKQTQRKKEGRKVGRKEKELCKCSHLHKEIGLILIKDAYLTNTKKGQIRGKVNSLNSATLQST